MILKANTAYSIGFTINDSTGLAADADSLPTASVYANATEIVTSENTTVAKITGEDGCYTASFTTPESVTLGQTVKLLIKATVDTIASKAFKNLGLFGKTVDQLNDINTGSIRTELATELGRIDAAVSTRSTYAGGAVASVTAGVTVTTNNDKTGYSLSTAPPTKAEIKTEIEQAGSSLALIKSKTDKLPSSPAAVGSAMTLTADYDAAKSAGAAADIEELGQALAVIYELVIGGGTGDVAAIKTAVDSLSSLITSARAGYLDKLNVTGTLANTDNADTFKADLTEIDLSGLTVSIDTAAIITALKASTGWTEGGMWTFAELMQILASVAFGNCKDKSGTPGTYQLLDAEDGTTVISETTLSTSTPYVTTIKI